MYIFINTNKSNIVDPGRSRFTLAHELGHFFIPEHREKLESGDKLTYHPNNYYYFQDNIFETEAHIFSANLLMLSDIFVKKCNKLPFGLEGVVTLSEIFQTSILSTAYQYINCDILPTMLVKLDNEQQLISNRTAVSPSFKKLIKEKIVVQYNANRSKTDTELIEHPVYINSQFHQLITNLSNWAANIPSSSEGDLVVVEQSMQIGSFGSIVLIFPTVF